MKTTEMKTEKYSVNICSVCGNEIDLTVPYTWNFETGDPVHINCFDKLIEKSLEGGFLDHG